MAATNAQVQAYADLRVRRRAEDIRNLYIAIKDDKAVIDDVYANLIDNPTWTDQRGDNPPHLLTPNDVLAYNTFMDMFIAFIEGTLTDQNKNSGAAQYPVIKGTCVRAPRD